MAQPHVHYFCASMLSMWKGDMLPACLPLLPRRRARQGDGRRHREWPPKCFGIAFWVLWLVCCRHMRSSRISSSHMLLPTAWLPKTQTPALIPPVPAPSHPFQMADPSGYGKQGGQARGGSNE